MVRINTTFSSRRVHKGSGAEMIVYCILLSFQCRPKARAAGRARDASPTRICKHHPQYPSLYANICRRKAVETLENEQVHFKDWVVASKGFSEKEKAAFKVDSVAAFTNYWEEVNSVKENFDRSHEKGCGLWAKRYQSSAAVIQPFVNDFSPIIQIVRDFGAPYGAIAVGTMSLLFAVSLTPGGVHSMIPPAQTMRRLQRTRMGSREA